MGANFRDVHDHLIRVYEAMESYRELMSGALDAYLSNVSNRMNEVMKRLTIVAALFLPVSFITGLFGMNMRQSQAWTDNLFWGLSRDDGGDQPAAVAVLPEQRLGLIGVIEPTRPLAIGHAIAMSA